MSSQWADRLVTINKTNCKTNDFPAQLHFKVFAANPGGWQVR